MLEGITVDSRWSVLRVFKKMEPQTRHQLSAAKSHMVEVYNINLHPPLVENQMEIRWKMTC